MAARQQINHYALIIVSSLRPNLELASAWTLARVHLVPNIDAHHRRVILVNRKIDQDLWSQV